jgi:hypothetical protein
MQKGDYITTILRSPKTVFSFKDIMMLWSEANSNAARVRVNYYVKSKKLIPLRRGIYAKDESYNRLELATKIITPAYVSFETVLTRAGIIFQYYEQIFVASYLSRTIVCNNQTYAFKKIKRAILTNREGIENLETYAIATTERAFLDTLYINKDYYFDNLAPLNWEKVFAILPIYENTRMAKKINNLYKQNKNDAK